MSDVSQYTAYFNGEQYTAYFNGDWVPWSQVTIDPMDRGFLVGDCVYDVARTFNGKSFRVTSRQVV